MDAMSYWLGFLTLPVTYVVGVLLLAALLPQESRTECGVCGYVSESKIPMLRWITWKWHRVMIFPRAWHSQALAVWRIERGRDPLTGELDG